MYRSAMIVVSTLSLTLGGVTTTTAAAPAPASSCRPSTTALPLVRGGVGGQVISGMGDRFLLGGVNLADGTTVPVSWRDVGGRWLVSDLSDGGRYVGNANGADARGDVLIDSGVVRTPDGRYHQLKGFTRPSSGLQGRQINADGVIAGTIFGLAPDFLSTAAVWSSYSAPPRALRPLPFPASIDSVALGINDAGAVVGNSDNADFSDFRGGIWGPGRSSGHVLPGLDGTGHSSPLRVNDAGQIVGDAANADFTVDGAAQWSATGHLHYLGVLLPSDTSADLYGLAKDGRAVGTSRSGDNVHFRLIYWPGHGPLQTVLPLTGDWINGTANAHYVTNHGTIGGNSSNSAGQDVPVVWTCADQQAFVPPTGQQAPITHSPHDPVGDRPARHPSLTLPNP